MACVSPDGKPTESGIKLLRALKSGPGPAEQVAAAAGLPLFRVRSGLRELAQNGFVEERGGDYVISPRGAETLGEHQ